MIRKVIVVAVAAMLVLAAGNALAAWGAKELENETNAVTFAREVASGGYQLVTTKELKGWIDEKKAMIESLTSIRRAGADFILTYFAKDAAKML